MDRLNPAPASDPAEALKLPRNFMGYSFIGPGAWLFSLVSWRVGAAK